MHEPVVAMVVATLTRNDSTVPGLCPDLCHDRGLASSHPRDCHGGPGPGVQVSVEECDSGTGNSESSSLSRSSFRDWQTAGVQYKSTHRPIVPINRHQSSISSLESLSTSKYPQLLVPWKQVGAFRHCEI